MDTAYLFDHAKGHTLPRDKETVRELGDIIRTMRENIKSQGDDFSDEDSV